MKLFIFVEIRDAPVVQLLNDLRNIFNNTEKTTTIHITIRGPYQTKPSQRELEGFREIINEEGILISGVGAFSNRGNHVVYLNASNKILRKMWWKPDYPIKDFGFNPHISMYEGQDKLKALAITKFLKKEALTFYCRDLAISVHDSKQTDLFQNQWYLHKNCLPISPQIETQMKRVKPDLRRRALELMHTGPNLAK